MFKFIVLKTKLVCLRFFFIISYFIINCKAIYLMSFSIKICVIIQQIIFCLTYYFCRTITTIKSVLEQIFLNIKLCTKCIFKSL